MVRADIPMIRTNFIMGSGLMIKNMGLGSIIFMGAVIMGLG